MTMTKTTYVKGRQKAGGQTGPSMAQTADRHVLYEASVQAVEHEVEFVSDTYHSLRGKRPRVLREDFCGTTNASCE